MPTCKPYFSQFATSISPDTILFSVVMDEHLASDYMLSSTVIGVELHRLGLKFRLVELQLDQI